MKIQATLLPGCFVIEPDVHGDQRGFFLELYQAERFAAHGLPSHFVQDNFSRSGQGTLRGLHYQIQQPQGKLVQVVRGEVYDVAVDLRRDLPTFGQWTAVRLDEASHRQLYVPPGCAHGFYVVSESADFLYKCTNFYAPEHERTLLWNDPTLNIEWPLNGPPLLSQKDQHGLLLTDCETYPMSP